ncbi:synaptosomal-associated protein 29-like [Ruditapes philippinarum]|uniref:synaptosomal-associated protein 29-like n=1 Tax=Ruditapes philippinarum TaxID=129788 RepID=UPI00295A87D5|nr:synaptosomal-associated protein 29-like [Ruditapes philippinarum]
MSNPFHTNSNPFDEDDDDNYRKKNNPKRSELSHEEQIQRMMMEIDDSEYRQLESTKRALASIDDSERTGIATAEELLHQREQLVNIEKKTDIINQDLKTSQKHLTNIKSIFGGIKNWWNGDKDKDSQPRQSVPGTSKLQSTLDSQSASRPPPGQRYKTDDGKGFYEDDLDDEFMKGSRNPQGKTQYFKPVTNSRKEELLNDNLDLMSEGMERLKGLAQGLGDEIETQNTMLDRINTKTDRADIKLTDQNRQMRGILK